MTEPDLDDNDDYDQEYIEALREIADGFPPDVVLVDLTDQPAKPKFKPNLACCWYGAGGTACGDPLAEGDIAFCPRHRRQAESYRKGHYK